MEIRRNTWICHERTYVISFGTSTSRFDQALRHEERLCGDPRASLMRSKPAITKIKTGALWLFESSQTSILLFVLATVVVVVILWSSVLLDRSI